MTEDQIKHMVSRFLAWRLPENFNPDGGVKFEREVNGGPRPEAWWPNGTNVLDAVQAEAMVRHMIEDMPCSLTGEDDPPFFRAYALKAGDVLTEQNVSDIQKVLADYNDEIGKAADVFHDGRMRALQEIGGDELVAAVTARDDEKVRVVVDKALARFHAKTEPNGSASERDAQDVSRDSK